MPSICDDDLREQAAAGDAPPGLPNKKQRIVLRVMSETPVHENPVAVIHELHPDAHWEFVGSEVHAKTNQPILFRMRLVLANDSFNGEGRTKKMAKAAAAKTALAQLYNITLNTPAAAAEESSCYPPPPLHRNFLHDQQYPYMQ